MAWRLDNVSISQFLFYSWVLGHKNGLKFVYMSVIGVLDACTNNYTVVYFSKMKGDFWIEYRRKEKNKGENTCLEFFLEKEMIDFHLMPNGYMCLIFLEYLPL